MSDEHAELVERLGRSAADYRDAKAQAATLLDSARAALVQVVTDLHRDGVSKADILRGMDYTWSRQWLDELLRGVTQADRCPQCDMDPADDPTANHAHLTSFGYVLFTPGHEMRDFMEELIEEGRRRCQADSEQKGPSA